MFGNALSVESQLFPKLISLNCVNFDFQECGFNNTENNKVDNNGDSREGTSRAQIFKCTQIPYVYTLEGNYATGVRINTLFARWNSKT